VTAAGIAAAVALLACLGSFLDTAQHSMTARAVRSVAVDWQVEVQPDAAASAVLNTVRSTPTVTAALPVGFAKSTGFVTQTGASTQTTGPATVLGIPLDYRTQFPDAIRTLVGAGGGVLLAQQTAANLHAAPGDTVQIGRAGMAPVDLKIDGVVDLPQADSLFQNVGAPPGAQPVAPPDNVALLDQAQWHRIFDPLSAARPDLVRIQIHTALNHTLPSDPATAFIRVSAAARNLEARCAGGALVGDNLGAALDAARGDAAYARVLFVFLGVPAAVLAALLTATLIAAGAERRRHDQALLRARGASQRQLISLAAAEAVVTGVLGSAAGLAIAAVVGPPASIGWAGASAVAGLAVALASVLTPVWRDVSGATVSVSRAAVHRTRPPHWTRLGADFAALAASGILFWLAGRGGYQIVLAPEGVPAISVSYWAFAAPALLWVGATLLVWRLADLLLGRGWLAVAWALRPVGGSLSRVIAHSLSRQRAVLARGIVLLAVAAAFAVSTATFNATYQAQAEVDAQLTNGSDVTVSEPPDAAVGPAAGRQLAAIPGVRAVEPIQHRFAYIGADLQDLYGVNPASITRVTALQNNYFHGGTAQNLLTKLAGQPDSVLVSAETVTDFQLVLGDSVNLRLPDARTHQLATVAFRYVGIVTEFPTAPKDSFIVANAAYVAQHTGTDAVGSFLVDTGGHDTAAVASRIRDVVGTTATVTDITATRGTIGSSLTAVNLAGLTRVELAFGLVLATAGGALVLTLGLGERRRSFAIAHALGATSRHLRSFVLAEAAILTACGLTAGGVLGAALSHMLVSVLNGVFDPPPTKLTTPGIYLAATALASVAAIGVVSAAAVRLARRAPLTLLGEP
jgi:putative ABC transport system permease protein